jgi:POT family proton-dependent oligopeptide transporter
MDNQVKTDVDQGSVAVSTAAPPAAPADPGAGDAAKTGHPPAIWFFFWGEFAERSSYYGMRAILFMYMTQALRLADTEAGPGYSAFKMACYFLPLVGGVIADRWLGRYWTIVGFSIPYVAGHFILGIPSYTALVIALALLAGGSGVIKPNISTLMGQTYDQLRPGREALRTAAFNWFYLSINIGALISMFCLPLVRDHVIESSLSAEVVAQARTNGEELSKYASQEVLQEAYATAFAFPAWLMVLSLVVFAAGKPFYATETLERHELTPEERRLQWRTLWRLFGIFGLVAIFWFGYEHNDTLWIAFTRDYVDLRVPFRDRPLSPDQLQFLNALFVIILIPLFNFVFGRLDPHVKIFTAMRKILAGFLLTATAVGIMSVAGFLVQGQIQQVAQGDRLVDVATAKVSVYWPAMAYIVLTFGEVLVYGTMLELAYTAAPKSMKSFITACFLVTNTLGNFLNMMWMPMYGGSLADEAAKRGPLLPGQFFGITALVVVAAALIFVFVGKQFERSQAEAAAAGVI